MKNKLFAGAVFALAMFATALTASAFTFDTTIDTLQEKKDLQTTLNMATGSSLVVDGVLGAKTTAALKAFQVLKSLVADGVAGPLTRAALTAASTTGTTTGTTTGSVALCPNGMTLASNCATAPGSTTGSTTTGLTGGAGEISLSTTSTDVEDSIKENSSEKILGFKAEGDGSDISVSSVKLVFAKDIATTGSERFTDYVSDVDVYLGSTKVGSASAEDFSRESGSPDVFSKTISLSNAVVKDSVKGTFFVEVKTGSIDTEDLVADWSAALDAVRYTDGTGAILSLSNLDDNDYSSAAQNNDADYMNVFGFSDVSGDDNLAIKSTTANPAESTIIVDENDTSDSTLIGAFKLEVDEDSSDITINEIPVVITIGGDAASADSADNVIDTLTVKIGSTSYDAELSTDSIENGTGTATYLVTLDSNDVVIDAGDEVEVRISAKFNNQDGNYTSGTTVSAKVVSANIDAEASEELSGTQLDGTFTGKTHTLSVNTPTFALVGTPTLSVSSTSDTATDIYLAKFTFNVTAPTDQDVYLPLDTFTYGTAKDAGVQYDAAGLTIKSAVLEAVDDSIAQDTAYLVSAGETQKFTFSVYLEGNDASGKVAMTSVWYETDEPATIAGVNGDPEVTTGFSSFKTSTVFLAK